ncbi:hypothetical protein C0992_001793 [Termitomyces sp. T32_za158]|nr:hypothetical protein C0992_001793 [Termitomyces sp. T32_za158]
MFEADSVEDVAGGRGADVGGVGSSCGCDGWDSLGTCDVGGLSGGVWEGAGAADEGKIGVNDDGACEDEMGVRTGEGAEAGPCKDEDAGTVVDASNGMTGRSKLDMVVIEVGREVVIVVIADGAAEE